LQQNIYITSLFGGEMPRELTAGTHGATHAPAFSPSGDLVAWLEMAEDGYESDR
jgi:Tol biopolymer transport system component